MLGTAVVLPVDLLLPAQLPVVDARFGGVPGGIPLAAVAPRGKRHVGLVGELVADAAGEVTAQVVRVGLVAV